MAKVYGPLHSDNARGKLADAMVFMGWKGRKTVRQLVIPANPKSDKQAEIRTFLGSCGVNSRAIEIGSDLQTQIAAVTPADQSWTSYFTRTQIGSNASTIKATRTEFSGLNETQKGYFNTAAESIPLSGFDLGYGTVSPITPGEQLYISMKAAYTLGLACAPADPATATEAQINAFAGAYKAA